MDQAISQLPDYNTPGKLTKLRLDPRNIPDLDWQLASELNTTLVLYHTAKIDDQTISTARTRPTVVTEIIAKTTKLKVD